MSTSAAPSMTVPQSLLRERLASWVSCALANHAVVAPMPETEQFSGRIRGVPSIAVVAITEGLVIDRLREALNQYGEALLGQGKGLPAWETPRLDVSADVRAVVRLSTLKELLKTRAAHWGASRQKLPAHVVDGILADFDQVITRHAMQINGAG